MPPKRRPKSSLEPPLKAARVEDGPALIVGAFANYGDSSSDDDDDSSSSALIHKLPAGKPGDNVLLQPVAKDTRADCMYGASCYRNNPDHYRTFRHPKGHLQGDKYDEQHFAVSAKTEQQDLQILPQQQQQPQHIPQKKADAKGSSGEALVLSPTAEIYAGMLKSALAKNRVTVDEKKLFRTFRRDNHVTDAEHNALLKRFFWTPDEWEDGEKQDDDVQLREERTLLESNRFGLVHITRENAALDKDKMAVFAKVSHLFFSTMSQAQANYEIAAVDVVVHPENRRIFENKRLDLASHTSTTGAPNEHWGFHGTSRESIRKITETNFLMPDEIAALAQAAKKAAPKKGAKGKNKKKPAMSKPIDILDEGYFGKGIYFTKFSDYALWYSDERESDQVLLSRLLTGREYECRKRMDGKGLENGFDSHVSPKGNEVVLFSASQILPRYVITFREKEAKEREQES